MHHTKPCLAILNLAAMHIYKLALIAGQEQHHDINDITHVYCMGIMIHEHKCIYDVEWFGPEWEQAAYCHSVHI